MTAKVARSPDAKLPLIHRPINKTPVNKDSIEGMTRETEKKVVGTFVNIECPGQPGKVCGRYYKGMEYFVKVFEDNERCEIPLSVARYINERIVHETHSYILNDRGEHIKNPKPSARYKFIIESIAA